MANEPLAPVKDDNVSDLPYHTKETEKIAAENQKAVEEASAAEAKEAELKLLEELKAKYPDAPKDE